jgi:hypothetical protein
MNDKVTSIDDKKVKIDRENTDMETKEDPKFLRMYRLYDNPFMLILGFLFYGVMAWYFIFDEDELFIKKEPLKAEITKMVINEANLDSLKHYFNNAEKLEWGIVYGWNNHKKDHYVAPISLVNILKDIQSDFYLKKTAETLKITRVAELIKEHEQRNPFDELSTVQRDQFNNIRIKLGSNYGIVEQEVNKLSNDMKQNNQLIYQYLTDSKTSLYVSIASLIFALITTVVSQVVYRKRSSKKINKD